MQAEISSTEIILIADPRIISIPIQENHEAMVDIIQQKTIAYGPSPEIPNNTDYTQMRRTVYEMLIKAQDMLPTGLKLCLYEAYRSLSLQKFLYDTRYEEMTQLYPTWSEDQLFDETIKLVSPMVNKDGSDNIPPHSTGGAVDVYLIDMQGNYVDMGIHPKDWMQDKEGLLSQTDSRHISEQAQLYRQILSTVMSAVGFINYPTEFWHWSYGDRYWAYHTKSPHAIYGTLQNR